MVTYGLTEEIYNLGDSARTSYGIAAYADADSDGSATILASVHDITSDKSEMEKLVHLCNTLGLSVLHLRDIVEDFLASKS